jgi:hypothetical protein
MVREPGMKTPLILFNGVGIAAFLIWLGYHVLKDEQRDYSEFKVSFLTHDKALQTIVRIDVGFGSEVSAHAIGRINGEVLETFDQRTDSEDYYKRYVDPAGKSIFDRYTVRHRPGQKPEDYHLEQYGR